ncbi:hypothetical protein [Nocardioides sp. zg-DK7169]|uniref:hypothetical protein n=1 Tax=Nocardioides sp. zg-DK7169 TaxID=2736600 RepID=UPI001553EE5E|nr:hypothetical protein [Nocardioides sp. zg-DK7169]NPC95835.1 hypothetical protein [Nocardioides sp. zg-DK7169]
MTQRIAWLLATSRLAADPQTCSRDVFVTALAEHGIHVDRTRISRWESGLHVVPERTVRAYETLVGAVPGSFLAIARGLARSFGVEQPARRVGGPEEVTDLDRVFEDLDAGRASGAQWLGLAIELTQYDRVYLHPSTWQTVCRSLLGELARAVGSAYVSRYEAATMLLLQADSQRHMLRALGEYCTDPHVQVGRGAVTMLAQLPGSQASDLLIRLHASGHPTLGPATWGVLAAKSRRQQFSDDYRDVLVRAATHGLRRAEATPHGVNALELAAHLPDPAFEVVLSSLRNEGKRAWLQQSRATRELVPAATARQLASRIADRAQSTGPHALRDDPDLMLRRLVREALFHLVKARRRHAANLLGASAYSRALAPLVLELAGGADEFLASRAWSLLSSLDCSAIRDRVRVIALDRRRPWVQGRALTQLGRDRHPLSDADAETVTGFLASEHAELRYAAMFALGMSGADHVLPLTTHPDAQVANAAQWWLRTGPALHDPVPG